jgi:hypothetical protein
VRLRESEIKRESERKERDVERSEGEDPNPRKYMYKICINYVKLRYFGNVGVFYGYILLFVKM